MSHIFDALQRSEAERSGVEFDACDLPTELLQIAESAAKARLAIPEEAAPVSAADAQTPAGSVNAEPLQDEIAAGTVISGEFESLPVSLMPHGKLVSVTQKESLAAEKFR